MRIGLDLMGGDHAPLTNLQGAYQFIQESDKDYQLVLIGDLPAIKQQFPGLHQSLSESEKVEFVHASEVIGMSESPTKSFSRKPDSTITKGFKFLEKGEIDAFASAGNTGAMMVGAFYAAKPLEGVIRPAISTIIPKKNNKTGILLDVGVNPDCKDDVLYQFGILGSAYLQTIYHIENPKVGLLNIGSEKEKGNLVTQSAYRLMEENNSVNFIGNVEGYDIFTDKADVIVCDGFTGNILLKTIEGFYRLLKYRQIKDEYFETFNYENYGGTPVLGISKIVMVAHGMSSPFAIKNMLAQTISIYQNKLIEKIAKSFKKILKF
ncbi:MAG TPA: phosphate acyltransferase PlsX [Bacteroidia bacterium]|nr:phosphate acyltransferase PlsX [Bacteroidia bacterium]HRS59329.1 phosphate acyltransferase PlsX [Bacteroidia bacterium]HRU69147.1 phosphate acyltransferase PlsX [Bacteroidia bacterium]